MAATDIHPRSWDRAGDWTIEPARDALDRTSPFGRRFFAATFAEFPGLEVAAEFLRWSEQPEDVYAIFEQPGAGFGVQIDPDLEYIIIWDGDGQAEYGDWGADQVPPAVGHIRRLLAAPHHHPTAPGARS